MNKIGKTQDRTIKSRIAVKKGSTLLNKENVPCNKGSDKVRKPLSGRKTLSSRNGDNSETKIPVAALVKSKHRVKTAPDFDKLHKKWEAKLAKGKAVTKRANTKIEAFNLTKEVNLKHDDIESTEFQDKNDLEDEKPVKTSQESEVVPEVKTVCCSCGETKASQENVASIPTTFKVPKSIRKVNVSSSKKKEKKVEFEEDPFEFKPDKNALESILNNDGIKSTPTKRSTGFCSPSPYSQKRTSIYYTGPRPDRPLSAFDKRLSMRRAATMMAKMSEAKKEFDPLNTLIGVHDIGNRFMTTPRKETQNDKNTNPECIPEETEDEETTQFCDTIPRTIEAEISWADTLKHYSQSQLESHPLIREDEEDLDGDIEEEDKEALIAQLEEEVRETLSSVALNERSYLPSVNHSLPHPSSTELLRNPNISIPLQQRRDRPSIYRKLFASPANVQKREPIVEINLPINVPASLPFSSDDVAEQRYHTEIASFCPLEPIGFSRLAVDSPLQSSHGESQCISEGYGNPLKKFVPFQPSTDENLGHRSGCTRNIGGEKLISTCSTIHGPENAPGGGVWVADSASMEKRVEFTNNNAGGTISSRCALQSLKNSAIGSASFTKPSEMRDFKHTSLVEAASASLDFKLKRKALENESVFKRIQASRLESIKNPPKSEQNILIPKPVRHVVAGDEGFVTRHRQIMHEALVKSRDHAQVLLLDAEVSMHTRSIGYLWKYEHDQRLVNPLAKVFNEGDERHFIPILV
ncbi:uncharacterized protein LOC114522182 [Dendronephthya gigantea]|uniref:uncharacterized protein LOC114522182 n=1 Tax=Dendronephthya gigantea TaxID=151771 RepID=UPI00106B197C|nr:uncharacterized protein LOC114522182 [Dendronephthya gigantea]